MAKLLISAWIVLLASLFLVLEIQAWIQGESHLVAIFSGLTLFCSGLCLGWRNAEKRERKGGK